MNQKIVFLTSFASDYSATVFLTEIFFQGGTKPRWKIKEILGCRGVLQAGGVGVGSKSALLPGGYGHFLTLHIFLRRLEVYCL